MNRKDIKITSHALQQYEARTGRRGLEGLMGLPVALKMVENVTLYTTKERGFSIVKVFAGDKYLIWYDENIKEEICGIVSKDNALKTVLTKKIYSWANRSMKVRNEMEYKYGGM